ncbi:hypothetical protein BC567DRAFT_213373 [Phyllosticta citribraziliensis]
MHTGARPTRADDATVTGVAVLCLLAAHLAHTHGALACRWATTALTSAACCIRVGGAALLLLWLWLSPLAALLWQECGLAGPRSPEHRALLREKRETFWRHLGTLCLLAAKLLRLLAEEVRTGGFPGSVTRLEKLGVLRLFVEFLWETPDVISRRRRVDWYLVRSIAVFHERLVVVK